MGGIKQDGIYSMDCRFNKIDLIARIKKIAKYKKTFDFIRKMPLN